jgi:uncharacterized damage-inducible protein DinB
MGARAESLAKQFEAKAAEMTSVIKGLSDSDWKKTTEAEKWSVGVTAHHVAGGHAGILGIVKTLAAGQSIPNFTMDMLHEMNATHAKEQSGCTKAETLALHEKGAATAAAVVRGLSDAELDQKGTVLVGVPTMTTQQAIESILINHINDHMGSIRKTVGA